MIIPSITDLSKSQPKNYLLMVSQGTKVPYIWGKALSTLSEATRLATEQARYLNANKGEYDPPVIVTVLRKVEEYGKG